MFSERKGIKLKTNNKKKNWETQKYVKIKQKAQATNDSMKKYKKAYYIVKERVLREV